MTNKKMKTPRVAKVQKEHRIQEIYAFIGFDKEQNAEGIPAVVGPEGDSLPMIASDLSRVEFFRPMAQQFVEKNGMELQLVKFGSREVLEEFKK